MQWELIGRDPELEMLDESVVAGRSTVVVGDAGVGKSHLVRALADRADTRGDHVERIVGSVSGRSLPFAAVAHLLEGITTDPAAVLGGLRRAVHRRAAERPLLVVVDDLDLLDDATRTFVESLAREVPVVGTVRRSEASDPWIVSLWKGGGIDHIDRIDLEPLDRPAVIEIASQLLGKGPSPRLIAELWQRSGGNPLLVRELCLAGREAGAIRLDDEQGDLVGPLRAGERIVDLIGARLDQLARAEREVLGAIAILDPAPSGLIIAVADTGVIAALEDQRLVRHDHGDAEPALRPAHPLIGEAARTALSDGARAALVGVLARAAAARELDASTVRRLADLAIQTGEPIPAALARRAATAALGSFDFAAAVHLAASAADDDPRHDTLVTLARAQGALGDLDGAERSLAQALELTVDTADRCAVLLANAELLMFVGARVDDAVTVLRHGLAQTPPGPDADRLRIQLVLAHGLDGDFARADEAVRQLLDNDDVDPAIELAALMVHTLGLSLRGEVDGIDGLLDRGDALAADLAADQPLARDQLGLNRVLARLASAEPEASTALVASVTESPEFGDRLMGPWRYIDAMSLLLRGEVDNAVESTSEAVRLQRESDPIGTLTVALALAALGEAMRGNTEEALARLDELAAHPASARQIRVQVWAEQARAWLDLHLGDVDGAAARVVEIGERGIGAWHTVWGAISAHAAVRFGRPMPAHELLQDLHGEGVDHGPLVMLLSRHAEAAAQADPVLLAKVGAEWDDRGYPALAAEALAALAMAADGQEALAAPAATRALVLAGRCPGLISPLIAQLDPPLTDRQLEVAILAAAGRSSRHIAEELHLSTKTIDNHLQSVYRILGVGSRRDLAVILR